MKEVEEKKKKEREKETEEEINKEREKKKNGTRKGCSFSHFYFILVHLVHFASRNPEKKTLKKQREKFLCEKLGKK